MIYGTFYKFECDEHGYLGIALSDNDFRKAEHHADEFPSCEIAYVKTTRRKFT